MPRYLKSIVAAGILAGASGLLRFGPLHAQQGHAAVDALRKAGVNERLVERTAPHPASTGTAPSFVVDPGWPKPLPNNWIIGDIGGLYVDRHDHIWVYHRPRALDSTDAGALGEAGKDAKGNPISVLGHPRPVRPAVRLLHSGALGAGVRQGGQAAARVGRPGRPRFPREEVPPAGRLLLAGARARHLCRSQRLRLRGGQRPGARTSTGSFPGRRTSATTRRC